MKVYRCADCNFLMGKTHGPGVRMIKTSLGPQIRCGRCGGRVFECIVSRAEKRRIMKFWNDTKNDVNELGSNVV